MIKVAIAGNIASGKSEMEKFLEEHNYVVLDTDLITHDILIDKPDVAQAFSEYDVFEFGRLSKDKLGKLIFSDPKLKKKLEDIVHPLIKEELKTAFDTYSNEDIIFVSVPLLYEVGWENMFDKVVFIKSDDNIRLNRLIKRNGYSEEYAKIRLASQLPQEEKAKKSDYTIKNNGTKEEFKLEIEKVIKLILS